MRTKCFQDLMRVLDREKPVIIQAHDYPDHDAIGSGFSLLSLLRDFGFRCEFCYGGEVQGFSVADIITNLHIPLVPASLLRIGGDAQIILVDAVAGNTNVTRLTDLPLTGIIDHHQPPEKIPECPFVDIRPEAGSCSTIIYQYYLETMTEPSRDVATALLTGLMMDTAQMTRGVGPVDLAAFSGLFFKGDWEGAVYILRNSFSIQDIPTLRYAFDHYYRHDSVCFVELEPSAGTAEAPAEKVRPELPGLISDYFLRMQEIHFVVTSKVESSVCRLSLRSEDPRLPADLIVKRALEGIGEGGGHPHMSGGTISGDSIPGGPGLRERFLTVIEKFLHENKE
ncbi:MAG: DHH family phosphoesterase [Spirochaetales bacterium]|jgi:nanoRNase/pAp phosphatase (c-di-AMP/oligoRNAs hydrolase)|nr:DHH family phosphoesterase [Spirochaetales bacterium]